MAKIKINHKKGMPACFVLIKLQRNKNVIKSMFWINVFICLWIIDKKESLLVLLLFWAWFVGRFINSACIRVLQMGGMVIFFFFLVNSICFHKKTYFMFFCIFKASKVYKFVRNLTTNVFILKLLSSSY